MLKIDTAVQVSDTTKDESGNAVRQKRIAIDMKTLNKNGRSKSKNLW